ANKYGYELVATNDIHYVNKEDYEAREIIMARSFGMTWEEHKQRSLLGNPNGFLDSLYIKSKEEMAELFGHLPEA
ncbi:MAG: hypothetical protein IJH34_05410, partial [Romboutsia sp.]|nr:hypothetical protein [Romboutsia sp.]